MKISGYRAQYTKESILYCESIAQYTKESILYCESIWLQSICQRQHSLLYKSMLTEHIQREHILLLKSLVTEHIPKRTYPTMTVSGYRALHQREHTLLQKSLVTEHAYTEENIPYCNSLWLQSKCPEAVPVDFVSPPLKTL